MQFTKETYSVRAAAYIRSLIRDGKLQPGQPVREAQLSEKLSISRAPVREALLILAHQGLVSFEPQKGKYVRSMSAREILDSYAVAGILEGAAVAQSLPLWTDRERAAFDAVVRRLDEEVNDDVSPDALAEIDESFPMTLLSACDNERLVDLARTSCSSLAKFLYYTYWRTLFTPRDFRDRHDRIVEAVHSGDPVRIETTLRRHYEEVGHRLSERVRQAFPAEKS